LRKMEIMPTDPQVIQWTPELVIDDSFEGVVAGMPQSVYFATKRFSTSRMKYLVYELRGSSLQYWAIFITMIKKIKIANAGKGTLQHSVLLEGRQAFDDLCRICQVDLSAYSKPKSSEYWKKDKAKAEAEGKILLLPGELQHYEHVIESITRQKVQRKNRVINLIDLFKGGLAELSIFTNYPGTDTPFQIRVDYARIHDPITNLIDLKTVSGTSMPEVWKGQAYRLGAHIQAYVYPMIYEKVLGVRPDWNWVVMEQDFPHEARLVPPEDDMLDIGKEHAEEAMDLYQYCMRTGDWFQPSKVTKLPRPFFANYLRGQEE